MNAIQVQKTEALVSTKLNEIWRLINELHNHPETTLDAKCDDIPLLFEAQYAAQDQFKLVFDKLIAKHPLGSI